MLLNKLAKYHGIRDSLTQKAIDNIHSFNECLDQPRYLTSKLNLALHHIFKEVVYQKCDDAFINAICSSYLRKANWLKDSVWNTRPNRSIRMAEKQNVGFNQVNLEEYFSHDSKADLEYIINYCKSLPLISKLVLNSIYLEILRL